MIRFLYDTSCLVPLYSIWHAHHQATATDWQRRQHDGHEPILALPCVQEYYSVATGMPGGKNILPRQVWQQLEQNAAGRTIVGLTPAEALDVLRDVAERGIRGGQIYDALIAACARKAGCAELVTWNLRRFARFGGAALVIVNPLGERA